jgi:hypothetical protein
MSFTRQKRALFWISALTLVVVFWVPSWSLAFRAPDSNGNMSGSMNLGLRSVLIREVDEPLRGDNQSRLGNGPPEPQP